MSKYWMERRRPYFGSVFDILGMPIGAAPPLPGVSYPGGWYIMELLVNKKVNIERETGDMPRADSEGWGRGQPSSNSMWPHISPRPCHPF